MQKFSFLGKIALVSGRYWDDIDPNDNSGMQKISRRVISTYIPISYLYQNLPGSTILNQSGTFRSPIYQSNIGFYYRYLI